MIGVAAVSKYPAELKERAVAMARDLEHELGPGRGAIARVAAQLGIHPKALRYWVRRDEAGHPPTPEPRVRQAVRPVAPQADIPPATVGRRGQPLDPLAARAVAVGRGPFAPLAAPSQGTGSTRASRCGIGFAWMFSALTCHL
jgi:transposase-like protein